MIRSDILTILPVMPGKGTLASMSAWSSDATRSMTFSAPVVQAIVARATVQVLSIIFRSITFSSSRSSWVSALGSQVGRIRSCAGSYPMGLTGLGRSLTSGA